RVQRMKRQLIRNRWQTLQRFYTSMFSEREVIQGEEQRFITNVRDYFAGDTLASLSIGLEYLLTADFRTSLDQQPPLLLIHGEHDVICPPEATAYIVEHTERATRRIVPEAGHL